MFFMLSSPYRPYGGDSLMADRKVKNLILSALERLHDKSTLPTNEQWFQRGYIARELGTPGGLNPARVNALKAMVQEGKVLARQRPNDRRDLPEYRLAQ
jgi:hypothetical protein